MTAADGQVVFTRSRRERVEGKPSEWPKNERTKLNENVKGDCESRPKQQEATTAVATLD